MRGDGRTKYNLFTFQYIQYIPFNCICCILFNFFCHVFFFTLCSFKVFNDCGLHSLLLPFCIFSAFSFHISSFVNDNDYGNHISVCECNLSLTFSACIVFIWLALFIMFVLHLKLCSEIFVKDY